MLLPITNEPRDYAWGSHEAIAEFTGRPPSGGPEAELWLGSHQLSPSRILTPEAAGGHERLDEWIAADPEGALGASRGGDEFPVLMKVLAAAQALSIQVHPDAEQAQRGFADENARGVALTDPERTYKDPYPKPELALALGGPFDALVGFRPLDGTKALIAELAEAAASAEDRRPLDDLAANLDGEPEEALRRLVAWFLDGSASAESLCRAVVAAAERYPGGRFEAEARTLAELGASRPGDPGILVASLMNRVHLEEGEAVYVRPGEIHAYLGGLAIEVMRSSDNVIRAGLTGKHIDVDALQRITDFRERREVVTRPTEAAPGVAHLDPGPEFALTRLTSAAASGGSAGERPRARLSGPAVAVATAGSPHVYGARNEMRLERGQALYVTPDEKELTLTGQGQLVLATPSSIRHE